MSNTTKNLKKRLKAPRELVNSVKQGERVTPVRETDTNATHIRHFSKALAAYTCAAAVLIGGSLVLPALVKDGSAQPLSQPSGSAAQIGNEPNADQAVLPQGYVRPELIWANELNPELKDTVIWSAEKVGDVTEVTKALTLPDVGGEDAEYAVEFRMEIDEDAEHATLTFLARHMAVVGRTLEEMGFEKVDVLPVDRSGKTSVFAASRAELAAVDAETILPFLERADGDLRFVLQIAWQSTDGSQTPTNDSSIIRNGSSMDLAHLGLDRYICTDKEDYLRPDLIWQNEDNPHIAIPLYSANRWANGLEDYSLLGNSEQITDYTFAVDVQLMFVLEDGSKGEEAILTGVDEAKMVEQVLGWKPIVAGESYEATCEQLMALNDAEIIPAFADAYESIYGIDADSIPNIFILIDIAWQSVE